MVETVREMVLGAALREVASLLELAAGGGGPPAQGEERREPAVELPFRWPERGLMGGAMPASARSSPLGPRGNGFELRPAGVSAVPMVEASRSPVTVERLPGEVVFEREESRSASDAIRAQEGEFDTRLAAAETRLRELETRMDLDPLFDVG